jgi:DNA-binding CsgD family transcriptional regulator
LFNRDLEMVVWASERTWIANWEQYIAPNEKALIQSAEVMLRAVANDEVLPTPPSSPLGMIVTVSQLRDETPLFSRCAAIGFLDPHDENSVIMQLSEQERMVARFLIQGYQPLNIAAITGISENTVRTYVRRSYKKLEVKNRAELVRKLLSAPRA